MDAIPYPVRDLAQEMHEVLDDWPAFVRHALQAADSQGFGLAPSEIAPQE